MKTNFQKKLIRIFVDLFVMLICYIATVYFYLIYPNISLNPYVNNYIILFLVFIMSYLAVYFIFNVHKINYSDIGSYKKIIIVDIIILLVIGTFAFYFEKTFHYSRAVILITIFATAVIHILLRWLYTKLRIRKIRIKYIQKKKTIYQPLFEIKRKYQLILLFGDIIIISIAFLIGFYIRFNTSLFPSPSRTAYLIQQLYKFSIVNGIFLTLFYVNNLYIISVKLTFDIVPSLIKAVISGLVLTIFISFLSNTRYKNEWIGVTIVAIINIFILCSILRYFVWQLYKKYTENIKDNIIIIGKSNSSLKIINKINNYGGKNKNIVQLRLLDDKIYGDLLSMYNKISIKNQLDDFEQDIKNYNVDIVIIDIGCLSKEQINEIIGICNKRLISFWLTSDKLDSILLDLKMFKYFNLTVLETKISPLERLYNRIIKRIFDIVFSLMGIVILSPLFIIISILIKLGSSGPIFFIQKRLTKHHRYCNAIKFRTMYINMNNLKSDTPWTEIEDKRVTKIGKILRKTSIDEFPQLFNILKGDISLVGPRALAIEDEKYFDSTYFKLRYKIKTGLTGWAQVHGLRGGHRFINERTRFDLWYIENWSLWLDIKIIFLTILEMFFGFSAY